jgi:hypothetical protein
LLGQTIANRFAVSCSFHQPGLPKSLEMVGEQGLFDLENSVDLSNLPRPRQQ